MLGLVTNRIAWIAVVVAVLGSGPGAAAQQPDDTQQEERLDQAQSKEVQPLLTIVDEYQAGQPAPMDFPMELRTDFLKAAGAKTYVPYTVAIDQPRLDAESVMLYLRVVSAAAPGDAGAADASLEAEESDVYAYEDLHFVDLRPPGRGEPYRISRAFAVPPGAFDVYIALRERGQESEFGGAKTSVLRQRLDVPDFFDGALTTSTLILAERLDRLAQPLPADQQVLRPYALGSLEIAPAWTNEFTKTESLSLFFVIYNSAVSPETHKPDVLVDYNFHQRSGTTETFFNKTNPQLLNAQTLPPQFDVAAGHQLVAGQTIPLNVFPVGDYRMEVTITDQTSGQSLTRDVNFSVRGS